MIKSKWLLFFVPLFLSLPFLNRAYFVDDSYFVEIATWLKAHPSQPYDFRTDDAGLQNPGWEKDGFVRMVNPLVHHYFLAGLMNVSKQPWFLRLGCVLLSCFSALFLFELARRWTNDPFWATLLVLVTPVSWLTAHSLLIDSTLAFFFLGGLYFFLRSFETDRISMLIVSGLFMGLAILTKYPGVFVIPLTMTWLALRWKKTEHKARALLPWALGALFLIGYSWWTMKLYGRPHILAASERMVRTFGWPKVMSFFVFFSGSTLIPLLAWGVAPRRTRLVGMLIVVLLMGFFASYYGGFSKGQGFLLGLWLVTSVLALIFFWSFRRDWIYPRDHFLFFWILGFIAMMLVVMDWVAVRYYAIAAPAIVFAMVRLVEMRWKSASERVLKGTCAVMLVFTAALAYADYQQAEPSRRLVGELKDAGFTGGERHFYLGDSFTMSYLRGEGWVPCFPDTVFQKGDLILAKEVTMPLVWFLRKPIQLRRVATFESSTMWPLKVMHFQGSAGFYASVWGALPFTFATGPWERFHLFEVEALKDHEPS